VIEIQKKLKRICFAELNKYPTGSIFTYLIKLFQLYRLDTVYCGRGLLINNSIIFLEGLRKAKKNFSQDNRYSNCYPLTKDVWWKYRGGSKWNYLGQHCLVPSKIKQERESQNTCCLHRVCCWCCSIQLPKNRCIYVTTLLGGPKIYTVRIVGWQLTKKEFSPQPLLHVTKHRPLQY
jgi:hypothetical protein